MIPPIPQTVPARLMTAFKDRDVTVERHGDAGVVLDANGTEIRRFAVANAAFRDGLGFVVLGAPSTQIRIGPEDVAVAQAMFPEVANTDVQASIQREAVPRTPAALAISWLDAGRIVTVIYAVLGIIGGIFLAAMTVESESGLYSSQTEHPFVIWGVVSGVTAIMTAVVVYAVLMALSHLVQPAKNR